MLNEKIKKLSQGLHSMAVFRSVLKDDVVAALIHFFDVAVGENFCKTKAVDAYTEFVSRLYSVNSGNLSKHIQELVYNDENVYTKCVGNGKKPTACLEESVLRELEILQSLSALKSDELIPLVNIESPLAKWENKDINLIEDYKQRIDAIHQFGYGIYARYHMFYIDDDNRITPVKNPDSTRLDDLVDYKREQQIILDNTKALLNGKPAANVLLTGDAGTGKSSTIKAVVNELYKEGLRILEVRKEQLSIIPSILDELTQNPLKFIIFIDDLSFQKDDDNFSALKAILEGSVSAKSQNVAIYATSNRRHLVKEKFSDREGDDIHFNDTMQEIISLSERFGIQITFNRPDKKTYLDIVHHLVEERGIEYDAEKLDVLAERFVLNRGSRSARAAKQFADSLVANGNKDVVKD